jgi:hypothetical protein
MVAEVIACMGIFKSRADFGGCGSFFVWMHSMLDPTYTPDFDKALIFIHLRRNSKRRGTTPGAASAFWG